jgi:hypothetical protein
MAGKKTQADIEWENRTLCSDESCIGVIGPDGRCKECGRPYEGTLERIPPAEDETDASASAEVPERHAEGVAEEGRQNQDGDEWENRTLCSDESCIGVIGPDGRCKECGKPYAGGPED